MNFKWWMSWQMALICAGCLMTGAGSAFVTTVFVMQSDMATLAGDLKSKTLRVRLLESLVLQQSRSDVAVALDQIPPAAADQAQVVRSEADVRVPPIPDQAQPAPTQVAAAVPSPPSVEIAPHASVQSSADQRISDQEKKKGHRDKERLKQLNAKDGVRARKEAASVASDGQAVNPAPATSGSAPAEVAVTAPAAVKDQAQQGAPEVTQVPTATEIAAALKSARIEGVSAEKAGVERLSAAAVYLRGGKVIKVGAAFPSGERLLSVDPDNGRIITNQRQILMFN